MFAVHVSIFRWILAHVDTALSFWGPLLWLNLLLLEASTPHSWWFLSPCSYGQSYHLLLVDTCSYHQVPQVPQPFFLVPFKNHRCNSRVIDGRVTEACGAPTTTSVWCDWPTPAWRRRRRCIATRARWWRSSAVNHVAQPLCIRCRRSSKLMIII